MKKKASRLSINKSTIANLQAVEMEMVKGGTELTDLDCPTGSCQTWEMWCPTMPAKCTVPLTCRETVCQPTCF